MYWYQAVKIKYTVLSAAEKKAADFVLAADEEELSIMTLRQGAAAAGVGQQTLVRFLQKCGFVSWKNFQHRVCSGKEIKWNVGHEANYKLDAVPAFAVQNAVKVLSEMAYSIDKESFRQMIKALRGARMIDIYGVECSVGSAVDLAGKLLYLGMNCRTYTDMFFQKVSAEYLSDKDVAIGISQSGQSRVTIEALKRAKGSGALTIAVTSNSNSRITEYGDMVFVLPTMYPDAAWLNSRVAQTVFNDMIYQGLLLKDGCYKDNIVKSSKSVAEDIIY